VKANLMQQGKAPPAPYTRPTQRLSRPTPTHKLGAENLMLQIKSNFEVLLTVHLSIFFLEFNQFDAQNLFHNKFYFIPLHVSSIFAHHQEVKIALHSLWYHHINKCDDTTGCVMQF